MFQGAHEELKVCLAFKPLSRATENVLYNGVAIGSSANKGIDLLGFDEVLIVISEGAIAAGAALAYLIRCADNNTANDATLTTVTDGVPANAAASFTDAGDDTTKLIRIRARDVKRFLFVERTQTGAFAAVDSVHVILCKAGKRPVTNNSAIDGTVSVAYTHAS